MEEEFIEIPEEDELPENTEKNGRGRFFTLPVAAGVVLLLVGGAFVFGKYAGNDSSPFLANVSSLFKEAFSSESASVETIPLRGGDEEEVTPVASSRVASAPAAAAVAPCVVPSGTAPSYVVLLNEIAWAGAVEKPAAEWLELMNPGSAPVSLAGWQLVNKSGGVRVVFGAKEKIDGEGFYLLERKDDSTVPGVAADGFFSNAIKNNDETLTLFDAKCGVVDAVIAGKAWPAGEGYPAYRSMERGADLSWHTYHGNGTGGVLGTPRRENAPVAPVSLPETNTTTSALASSTESLIPETNTVSANTETVLISEVMAGMEGNGDYEFVELYNPGSAPVLLTGWSVKKRTSTGSESSLVAASRLEGKTIPAGGYFLIADEEKYTGSVSADAKWAKSYSLAYTNNAVVLMNAAGETADEASWTEIPKGGSFARVPVTADVFSVQTAPTPQNASGQ